MESSEEFPYEISNHAQARLAERKINLQWVSTTLTAPMLVKPHPHDANCRCAYRTISEADGRVLKVVYNTATEPWRVITVHFDRRMRGKL